VSDVPRRASAAVLLAIAALTWAPPSGAAGPPLAPPFQVRTVVGETLALDPLLEQGPVLLDFWATWCKPCLAALPELEAIHQRFASRGLTVIGVSVDGPRNYPKVRPFVRRLGLGFPIVLDEDGSLQRRYQAIAIPTSVLISPEGRMVRVTQGWRPGETADLERAIETLFADVASDSLGPERP